MVAAPGRRLLVVESVARSGGGSLWGRRVNGCGLVESVALGGGGSRLADECGIVGLSPSLVVAALGRRLLVVESVTLCGGGSLWVVGPSAASSSSPSPKVVVAAFGRRS